MGKTFNTGRLGNGLFTDANGNVGIGTSSPLSIISGARVLQVDGSSYSFVLATSGTVIAQMIGDAGAGAAFGSRSNHHMTLTTNDVERVRVTTTGNVGIGTSSPSSKLHIYDGTNPISLKIQRTSVPVYLSDVQIAGTTAGAAWTHNKENTSNGSVTWGASANTSYASSGIILNSTTGNSYITLHTANSANTDPIERVRISGAGEVGIGTDSPEGPLHIKGAISGGYVGMAIVNYVSTTNTSAGIDFGVDASGVYNGGGNAQISVVNKSGGDNRSEMNLKIWTGSALVTGIKINEAGRVSFPTTIAMNYAISSSVAVTVTNNCSPTNIASLTITTSGKPVLLTVSGDNNPVGGSSWCYVMIFRNGSAVGKRVICESPASSSNVPFALTHIDTPSAGTYTYSVTVSVCGGYPITFGETGDVQAPTITAVELL